MVPRAEFIGSGFVTEGAVSEVVYVRVGERNATKALLDRAHLVVGFLAVALSPDFAEFTGLVPAVTRDQEAIADDRTSVQCDLREVEFLCS